MCNVVAGRVCGVALYGHDDDGRDHEGALLANVGGHGMAIVSYFCQIYFCYKFFFKHFSLIFVEKNLFCFAKISGLHIIN